MLRDLHFPLGLALGAIATTLAFSISLGWIGTQAPPAPTPAPTPVPTAIPPFFTRTPAEQEMLDRLLNHSWFLYRYLVLEIPKQWEFWGGEGEHENDPMGILYRVWDRGEEGLQYSFRFEYHLATEYIFKDLNRDGNIDEITELKYLDLMPQSAFEYELDLSGTRWTLSRPAGGSPPSYVGTAFHHADQIAEAIREADKERAPWDPGPAIEIVVTTVVP